MNVTFILKIRLKRKMNQNLLNKMNKKTTRITRMKRNLKLKKYKDWLMMLQIYYKIYLTNRYFFTLILMFMKKS